MYIPVSIPNNLTDFLIFVKEAENSFILEFVNIIYLKAINLSSNFYLIPLLIVNILWIFFTILFNITLAIIDLNSFDLILTNNFSALLKYLLINSLNLFLSSIISNIILESVFDVSYFSLATYIILAFPVFFLFFNSVSYYAFTFSFNLLRN